MATQIKSDDFSVKITDFWNTYSENLKGIDNIIKFFDEEKSIWSLNKEKDRHFENFVLICNEIIALCKVVRENKQADDQSMIEIKNTIEKLSKDMCFSHSRLGKIWIEEMTISRKNGKNFTHAIEKGRLDSTDYDFIVPYFKGLFAIEFEKNFKEAIGYDQNAIENQISKATSTVNNNNAMIEKHESILTKLEESYKTKLHLEEPIKLWDQRKKRLAIEKRIWILLLFLSITIFLWVVKYFLYNPPPIVTNLKTFLEPNSIKIFLIIITTISLFGFLITFLAKLAYSSYHLQRDAEERRVLTDFYLSMLMRGNIRNEESPLIIQSLFSRADTGLLKGDSSPTMPNSMIEKIIELLKNK